MGRGRLPRTALLVGAVIALTGATLAVLLSSAGPRATPAFAVALNGNSSVTLTLRELLGVRGANEELSRLGVPVVIARVQRNCAAGGEIIEATSTQQHDIVKATRVGNGLDGLRWIIRPGAIPPGDSVQLTVGYSSGESSSVRVAGAWSLFRGRAPTCRAP
jgi:hypothetical protein